MMEKNVDIKIMLPYSAKKNITKGTEECSVKNPATNSDSASGRSIGARLVSAIIAIKNKRETGSRGMMYQIACWDSIIEVILKVPLKKITIKIKRLKKTSYAISLKNIIIKLKINRFS